MTTTVSPFDRNVGGFLPTFTQAVDVFVLPLANATHAGSCVTGSAVFDAALVVTMPKPSVCGTKF